MDFLTISLGLLLTWALIQTIDLLSSRARKRLPGPVALPVIGNLHLIGDKPHISMAKLAKAYGPIMGLKLGQITTVVITSPSMAKEVLQKQDLAFGKRAIPDSIHAQNHHEYSVIMLPVAWRWRSLRKIMNSHIFSGSKLDAYRHLRCKKVQELIACCHKNSKTGEAVEIGTAVFGTTLNSLANTIFSRDLTDPFSDSGKEFRDLVSNIMEEAGNPNLVDFFPFLHKVDPQGIRRRMARHMQKLIELFGGLIDERLQKNRAINGETSDVLDSLLNAQEETPEEIDRTRILRLCMDLFVAGTDTTTNTIEWAMAEAVRNPEAMKKAKAELEEVIGKGKIIDEVDTSNLPYLQCMVKETLRLHPPVPFLIPRTCEEDVEVNGYIVPSKSQVLVNVWAIGRDPAVWEDPLEFKPGRFLGSELDVRGRDFELIPFGAGRRICPGLSLAMRMVPVMLGSLLNSFDWKIEGGIRAQELDMEEKFGITIQKALPLRAVPIPL